MTASSETDALAEARAWCAGQRCCQHPNCEKPTARWEVHHVVYEQELHRRDLPKWDWRNCMRLCVQCHKGRHHNRQDPLPLDALTDEAIQYAVEVLGDYAMDYLARRYTA